jgi:hypothetical protein
LCFFIKVGVHNVAFSYTFFCLEDCHPPQNRHFEKRFPDLFKFLKQKFF